MGAELMQGLAVAGIVGAAVLYLGRRVYRTWSAARARGKDGGCGGGCCSPAEPRTR